MRSATGNSPRHAAYYEKDVDRFPQTYFGHAAASRLSKLGTAAGGDPPDILDKIPPPPSLRPFDEPIPAAAADRWARAQALRTIAFDASCGARAEERVLRYFVAAISLRSSASCIRSGTFCRRAWLTGASLFPISMRAKLTILPIDVWKVLYPLPYESSDPARSGQEQFRSYARGRSNAAGIHFPSRRTFPQNAIGLMQVDPENGTASCQTASDEFFTDETFPA